MQYYTIEKKRVLLNIQAIIKHKKRLLNIRGDYGIYGKVIKHIIKHTKRLLNKQNGY